VGGGGGRPKDLETRAVGWEADRGAEALVRREGRGPEPQENTRLH